MTKLFSGYKTYAVVAVLLIAVFIEKVLGLDVPGLTIDNDWLLVIMNALGLGTLRAAVERN